MSIGQLARRILGDRWFPAIGAFYRSLFVDLEKVADSVPPLPPDAQILDVGGGDGAVLNVILGRHPQARATMIDLAPRIGASLQPDRVERVRMLPGTSLLDYAATDHPRPDLVLISDVIHHVPVAARPQFFADLRAVVGAAPVSIFVKDIEPGFLRAKASYLADRYVSGDKQVELIGERALKDLLSRTFPGATLRSTDLMERDGPNYAVICEPLPERVPGSP